jgi:hypothetical protein
LNVRREKTLKSQWITYKGKKIFYANYSNFGSDTVGLAHEIEAVIGALSNEAAGSVLTLSDVGGTDGTPSAMGIMQNAASRLAPFARKRAVVGLTGIRKSFLNLVNKFAGHQTYSSFDDMEQAKDWLIAD